METSMDGTNLGQKNKANGKLPGKLGTLQDIVESQPKLKAGLEHVMDSKDEWMEEGGRQLSNVTQFLTKNWKTIVPAIAAVGIGAYFLTSKPAKVKKTTRK